MTLQTGLTNAALNQLRREAAALLPDTCTIQSVAEVADEIGGVTETWSSIAINIPCRLAPFRSNSGMESIMSEQMTPEDRYWLTLPHDQAITEKNRVIVGGVTYSITNVDTGKSYQITRRVLVERVAT